MGFTNESSWLHILKNKSKKNLSSNDSYTVALAGNPNTGKSTVFNSLTGLNQHTGNWPGKTVANAQGKFIYEKTDYILVDLPGTYSLMANSVEEQVARDFICFAKPDAVVVVVDATCLERNLNLVLQIMEITNKVILCVNLLDEAERKKIKIDLNKLSKILGIPVVGTNARDGIGLNHLKKSIDTICNNHIKTNTYNIKYNDIIENSIGILKPTIKEITKNNLDSRWVALRLLEGDKIFFESLQEYIGFDSSTKEKLQNKISDCKLYLSNNKIDTSTFRDDLVSTIVHSAEKISQKAVAMENEDFNLLDRKIDNVLTSKLFGIPIMIGLLGLIFWITIQGANYPSQLLASLLFGLEQKLSNFLIWLSIPQWINNMIVTGVYRTLAWVISVMLPPMAIFFPLFTLLEDLGYLPRVAFNLDNFFKKACAHGKQALTMCMGFGCNAAGVIACRIIDSPRERLIAIITNNFVPCNGRFPTLIALATIFIAMGSGITKSITATLAVLGVIVFGVVITLLISKILSKTILKGLPSSFTLELPPYRKPKIGRILIRSLIDRTLFVLSRAIIVAAPAGIVIWLFANIQINDLSILSYCANFLHPFAYQLGLDGYILLAFILGLPANEIVVPIIIMSYMSTGSLLELDSLSALKELLVTNGWTWLTALCTMLFSLCHFPCGTTLLTIRKETQSFKWTLISFIFPTLTGLILCFLVAQGVRLIVLI